MVDRKILKLGGKMDYEYDYEKLRSDLKDYYGTAMFVGFGAAMMDMSKIDKASDKKIGFSYKIYSNLLTNIMNFIDNI